MASKFLSAFTDPFISYFQATVGASCECLVQPKPAPKKSSKKSKKRASNARYNKRERKPSFSFVRCLQKQREMASPNYERGMISVDSVRDHYLHDSWNSDDSSPFIH